MRPARTLLSGIALTLLTSAALASTEPENAQQGAGNTEEAVLTAPVSEPANTIESAPGAEETAPASEAAAEPSAEPDVANMEQGLEPAAAEATPDQTVEHESASEAASNEEPASTALGQPTQKSSEPAAAAATDQGEPASDEVKSADTAPSASEPTTASSEVPSPPEASSADAAAEATAPAASEEVAQEDKFKPEMLRFISEAKGIADKDREALAAFYDQRGDDLLWMNGPEFNARAEAVMAEIRNADDWGLEASAFELPSAPESDEPASIAETELKLTFAALKYANHARGGRMNPKQLSLYIDREPPLLSANDVLSGLAAAGDVRAYLQGLHPQHPQFEKLRQAYLEMKRNLSPSAGADDDAASKPANSKAKKQSKGPPPQATLRKILHNMEQWRWMPEDLGQFHVWANVPEFTLRVMKDGEAIFTERLIAGKRDTQTPIFSDEMETIVLHPFWGVPDSIKVKELLPGLVRGSNVLARNDLRIQYRGRDIDPASVDWTRNDIRKFHVYQPPSGSNVLGQVKFLFPNAHQVYMHDTPAKNLFSASQRMFSHGCVRVRNPLHFAELLLEHDKGWDKGRVLSLVKSGPKDNHIKLDTKIPVHITYFTAWVGDDGKLKTWPDVYGHEQRIQMGIEGKAHLIARSKENLSTVQAEVVGRLAETKPSWSPASSSIPDWARRVFGN